MIIIDLNDLVYIVPDLINLFLSGFAFMMTYCSINTKKLDIGIFTIFSLFISHIIKSICAYLHTIIHAETAINDWLKIIIYSILGVFLALICTWLKKRKIIQYILYKTNKKSINNDIFEDIIDYDKLTILQVHLKDSETMYIGRFAFREEKGLDSWIALTDYTKFEGDIETFCPVNYELKSSVAINLNEVKSIEIIYKDDSKVWKRMTDESDEKKQDKKNKTKKKATSK